MVLHRRVLADQIKTSLNGLKQPFQSTLMIIREERTLTIVDIHKTKENERKRKNYIENESILW